MLNRRACASACFDESSASISRSPELRRSSVGSLSVGSDGRSSHGWVPPGYPATKTHQSMLNRKTCASAYFDRETSASVSRSPELRRSSHGSLYVGYGDQSTLCPPGQHAPEQRAFTTTQSHRTHPRTIRLGYAIQFARNPPKFSGIFSTAVRDENAAVLRAEIATLLVKDAIEPVPSADMKKGFYSPYFIVPKKGGGLRPILDLRILNRALHKLPFRMLTLKRILTCIRFQDWFVAIDLKDAYFHVSILPRHRPFLRFAFEGRAFQYKVLPFGLSLSPRVFTKVAEAALAPLRERGIRILKHTLRSWYANTGMWFSTIWPIWGFGSTGKRASSPRYGASLFSVYN
ncbi:hypothetical protein QQF64_009642 [Cirrhinus molitorella]|uniref:ribonuclease H n=1 Tax=Cirrhinus molitorella TaxID=172907 RepID=A0ABR3M2L5_9TELE